jgi:phage recombination protein Bet
MTQAAKTTAPLPGSQLISMMAKQQHLDANAFATTVQQTCFAGQPTREQFLAFLMIAKEHDLNPITREIFAFEKAGKIQTIVSIDGWLKIINQHPEFDGMEFVDHLDDETGDLLAVTCKIYRKDRSRHTEVTEYMSECKRDTSVWKSWPARMLRHKATIQGARYAFGFSGIVDQDEADRIKDAQSIEGVATIIPDDIPETAAKRLVSKVKAKVEEEDLMPETENPEPVGVDIEAGVIGQEGTAQIIAEEGEEPITADGEVIPGLKKASELTAGQQEFVNDMDSEETITADGEIVKKGKKK